MKFGLHFGSRGVVGDPDSLRTVAQKAQALGYEHFGMSDHVIVATEVESTYPYSKTGTQDTGVSLEQVTALSFAAAATTRIRLLTSVLVLPHRHCRCPLERPSHSGRRCRMDVRGDCATWRASIR